MKKPLQTASAINRKIRIIPKLEIKGENLIKGVQLEGLRVLGDPFNLLLKTDKLLETAPIEG